MTFRRTTGVLAFVLTSCLFQPVGAQTRSGQSWDPDRPDSRAPLSVTEDHTLMKGQVELGARYFNRRSMDLGLGTEVVSLATALNSYWAVPTEWVRQGAEVNLSVGITDELTLTASEVFSHNLVQTGVVDPELAGQYWVGETASYGPEDLKVLALLKVLDQNGIRVHLHGGVSIPLGLTDFDDFALDPEDPFGDLVEVNLPYFQQLGSGSFEILPGFTASIQNEKASLGIQWKAAIRTNQNDRNWTLGDTYTTSFWSGYKASDWVSVSLGAVVTKWGNVEGSDSAFNTNTSLAYYNPAYFGSQAGWRVDMPLGVNVIFPGGILAGHRISVEYLMPVHQNLDYLQLRHDQTLSIGWQKAVSF